MNKRKKGEMSLALRATWLHLVGGLTQIEVASRLNVSKLKAHRLISGAMNSGFVKVFIEGDITECIELEERLMEKYDLSYCMVAPCVDTDSLPLKTLGQAGTQYLNTLLESPEELLIGVGHGRTLAAMADALPKRNVTGKRFISLLGGQSRRFVANPFDVIHTLAGKTDAEAFVLPLPMISNSPKDKLILTAQQGVDEIFRLMTEADVMMVGIGSLTPTAYLARRSILNETDLEEIRTVGGVGEMLGRFFSASGALIQASVAERIISFDWESIKQSKVIALAGGKRKVRAIKAVLRSQLLNGLITDDRTAEALLA